jgi:MFS family permease
MIARQTQRTRLLAALRALLAPAMFRALASRAFALVWAGQTLSRIGDALYQIAVAWWVLERTGSAAAMATLLIVLFVPTVLLLLIGGVVVDRYSRVAIMFASDLLRGLIVCTVALLAASGLLQLWHLVMLNLVFGVVDAFFQPAYTVAVPELVREQELPSANALSSISSQLGRVAGAPLGAVIVAVGGTALAFALNGLTFLLAAALLVPLLRQARAPSGGGATTSLPESQSRSGATEAESAQSCPTKRTARLRMCLSSEYLAGAVADLREGLGTVFATPWLWVTIVVFALSNVTLAGPYSVALPFLVGAREGADVGTLALLYALFPLGYIIGGVWMGRREQIERRGVLVYGGLVVAGLALGVLGLPVPLAVLGAAALINGAALELCSLAWTSALQQLLPRDQLGRVSSASELGSYALIPIGYAVAGWSTELIGAPLVFLVGGGVTAAVAALVLATHQGVRRLQ